MNGKNRTRIFASMTMVAILAMLSAAVPASAWLMSGSTQKEIINVAVVALVGAVIGGGYALYRRLQRPRAPEQSRN